MKQIDSFVMWLGISVLILGALTFSVYILSILLPFVLLLLLGDFLWNWWRRWYYRQNLAEEEVFIRKRKTQTKKDNIIDAEYEILDGK